MESPLSESPPERPKLRQIIDDNDSETWEKAWRARFTSWKGTGVQPPLKEVIESGDIAFPREGRALVPGCGLGEDAIYIASELGLETIGLDISSTVIDLANRRLGDQTSALQSKVTFEVKDFFALDKANIGQFDIIYDYTFFVALPPPRRPEWGKHMGDLVKRGGYLVTLVYPIDPARDGGPPWYLRVEHYTEVLEKNFTKVLDKVPESSSTDHIGRERMAVWKRL